MNLKDHLQKRIGDLKALLIECADKSNVCDRIDTDLKKAEIKNEKVK